MLALLRFLHERLLWRWFDWRRRPPRAFTPTAFRQAMAFLGDKPFDAARWRDGDLSTRGRILLDFVAKNLPSIAGYDALERELGPPRQEDGEGGRVYWVAGHVVRRDNPGWLYDVSFRWRGGRWELFSSADPRQHGWLERWCIYAGRSKQPPVSPAPLDLTGETPLSEQTLEQVLFALRRAYRAEEADDVAGMEYDVDAVLDEIAETEPQMHWETRWLESSPLHFEVRVDFFGEDRTYDADLAGRLAHELYEQLRYVFWGHAWTHASHDEYRLEFLTVGSDEDPTYVGGRIVVR